MPLNELPRSTRCMPFMRKRLGREATYDEWVEHNFSLNIGMTKDELIPFDEEELPNSVED